MTSRLHSCYATRKGVDKDLTCCSCSTSDDKRTERGLVPTKWHYVPQGPENPTGVTLYYCRGCCKLMKRYNEPGERQINSKCDPCEICAIVRPNVSVRKGPLLTDRKLCGLCRKTIQKYQVDPSPFLWQEGEWPCELCKTLATARWQVGDPSGKKTPKKCRKRFTESRDGLPPSADNRMLLLPPTPSWPRE